MCSSLAGDRGSLLPTWKSTGEAEAQVTLAVPRRGASRGGLGGPRAGQRGRRGLRGGAGSGLGQHRTGEAQAG